MREKKGSEQAVCREAYLRALHLSGISEEKIQWHVRWVERFERFLEEKPLHEADRVNADAFISYLGSLPRVEPWQLRQAGIAVRILLSGVFGKSWAMPGAVPSGSGAGDFLEPLRTACRARHYSPRTEEAYSYWVSRFAGYCSEKSLDPQQSSSVRTFLEMLAVRGKVAAATQAQALNALSFWFRQVLGAELGGLGGFQRSKRPRRLPVVLTRTEVTRLLEVMEGMPAIMAGLLYGAGLRLMEVVRLRVKDVNFECRQILVHDGKGRKDRITMLPERHRSQLMEHLKGVRTTWEKDLARGYGGATFPLA